MWFKCFSAAVAEQVFNLQTFEGWSFDVEVLYIAREHGYTILEVPIHWYYISGRPGKTLSGFLAHGGGYSHYPAQCKERIV